MRTRQPTPLPTRSLDVLRAFAVLCVLLDHTIVSHTGEMRALWVLGRVGVLLFFVHTSLVLMSSLERSGDTAATFYVRRAFRIYPLAIATVVLAAVFELPVAVVPRGLHFVDPTARVMLSNLTLTTNLTGQSDILGPLWSLPLEVQMYALLPLCFLVACRGVRPTMVLMGGAIAAAVVAPRIPQLWRANVLDFAPAFVTGVLAYAWLRARRTPIGDLRESALTRAAHQIALYSYGIYLLHEPALTVAFVWGDALPGVAQWALYSALIVALPVAAFHAIEAPGIALGKRVAGWRPAGPAIESVP